MPWATTILYVSIQEEQAFFVFLSTDCPLLELLVVIHKRNKTFVFCLRLALDVVRVVIDRKERIDLNN